ncbi:bifunctional 2-C-methyl-D-erythritol 4-phosphate cytidylyltransferase/2-C-methyl-D-erythritol 2,4-cyclodiphosphate synthase [Thalassovita aquimarina]|uniref:Bifunctional enzyme IspD/IspF n=1 Tax=Thalassovita aquimarina TaxID=2785917 RepID=A0ABS5HLI2_9RHOB|nr:bifunctional 2-C-methyl-D-erythritol 4-phosphate cytidylyltransferase/2-C-methyl-D-erythritol 2,4-cyclodiphosphate synthase [Thalassovita aquimarina]MBR9649820.1 bifunctional 2-C-methyl-D-erythritol 4-phosphate cytidylyltransferase/2-C-methyl-D-erythritol 2,4-cyclodiphosphate synthase [Thalassovita aquimarina]
MKTAALIVAAGRGSRAGGGLPKQWRALAGRRVADWTLRAFADHPGIDIVMLVIHPDDHAFLGDWSDHPKLRIAHGGATRDASVLNGLEALEGDGVGKVLVHDVARLCVGPALIEAVLAALDTHCGAAPGLAVVDALWRGEDGIVQGVQDREGLYRAQTPQGFDFATLLAAHRAHPGGAADDVEVARAAGVEVAIVPGEESNLKITRPEDFARAERILGGQMDIRLGNGYDVHRFGDGDYVILCGVQVPHDRGLQGHSDADVGMHAVTDAIYGALAEGDIGRHFPPSDPQWKGAASEIFLKHAVDLAASKGFKIGNVDCTLVCEYPKVGPHAAAMQAEMARIMGLDPDRVSVKATTSERLGFTGRGEGIAALATATLVKP